MQATLFDAPAARVRATDPVTSVAAARSVKPGMRTQILEVLAASRCPLTADQIQAQLGRVRQDTFRSALAGLHVAGRIVAAGEGTSNTGRRMTKWGLA